MSDLISRQAAIEELSYCQTYLFDTRDHDEDIGILLVVPFEKIEEMVKKK